ncbi:MAG: single-stranded DNA-binding protein [Mycoplasmataceae bacterium]|jgi:single-strand DNA-binding protein|nr:single-stranded DNA-binding protein [Mycoplasmataceae bacterium]
MNKAILIGRIASDPILKHTASDRSVVNFNLAVTDSFSAKNSYFFPCIAWEKRADYIQNYLKKGDLVSVDGRLTRRSYTAKDGQLVYVTEVVIDQIARLSRPSKTNEETNEALPTPAIHEESITSLPADSIDDDAASFADLEIKNK